MEVRARADQGRSALHTGGCLGYWAARPSGGAAAATQAAQLQLAPACLRVRAVRAPAPFLGCRGGRHDPRPRAPAACGGLAAQGRGGSALRTCCERDPKCPHIPAEPQQRCAGGGRSDQGDARGGCADGGADDRMRRGGGPGRRRRGRGLGGREGPARCAAPAATSRARMSQTSCAPGWLYVRRGCRAPLANRGCGRGAGGAGRGRAR